MTTEKSPLQPMQTFKPKVLLNLLVLLLALTVSCSVLPPKLEPGVAAPPSFSKTGDAALPEKWWEAFGDADLNRLVEKGLAGNLDLRTYWERLSQAESLAAQAGAALQPQADLSGGAARAFSRTNEKNSYGWNYSLGASIGYELDLWGRIRSARDAARLSAQASREDVNTAAISLSAQIALTWYALAESYAQIEVLGKQIEANENVLDLITLRFRQGQTEAADVYRQRQLVESTRGQLVQVRSSAETLGHQLAVLVGEAPRADLGGSKARLVELAPLPATGLPADLIQRRPDIRADYLRIESADKRVAQAIADRFPRVGLSGGVETSGAQLKDLFDNWLASLAANLTQPLLDGGRRKAEIERTESVARQALDAYGQAVLLALKEVEDALAQEARQTEYLSSLERQLEIGQVVIERTRDSYSSGQLDYLRVLDALVSRQSLERNYLSAKRQHIEYRIDLCRAIAGAWPLERPDPAQRRSEAH